MTEEEEEEELKEEEQEAAEEEELKELQSPRSISHLSASAAGDKNCS